MKKIFLSALGITCSLGLSKQEVLKSLIAVQDNSQNKFIHQNQELLPGQNVKVANVRSPIPEIPNNLTQYNIRCNQLLLACYKQIENQVKELINKFGQDRVAVIIGSSTSGIDEGQKAIHQYIQNGVYPPDFSYKFLEMSSPAEFLANYLGLKNIFYTISTACSSSAKAFASARNLIELGICDAALVGGTDSLCKLTAQGFYSLEAMDTNICNPFSKNRKGITLGEGAALFIVTKQKSNISLLGIGESSDAYHTTAPDPSGNGAYRAMKNALLDARMEATQIDYLNLHGTGTPANDEMESKAVNLLFSKVNLPLSSSTKPLTGHTLGSAGAIELALCWLLLSEENSPNYLPIHLWDEEMDPTIEKLDFVSKKKNKKQKLSLCMSNSFAFGGSNTSLLIGKE